MVSFFIRQEEAGEKMRVLGEVREDFVRGNRRESQIWDSA